MKCKGSISIVIGVILILFSFDKVCAQKEIEVMKQYDYSSPKASYESLKRAIQDKDFEGVCIHFWQIGRAMANNADASQLSFEEFLRDLKNSIKTTEDELLEEVEEWYSSSSIGEWVKLAETEFLKEEEIYHSEKNNITYTLVTAQRKSDGKEIELQTINIDGTKEWWIFIYPGGE